MNRRTAILGLSALSGMASGCSIPQMPVVGPIQTKATPPPIGVDLNNVTNATGAATALGATDMRFNLQVAGGASTAAAQAAAALGFHIVAHYFNGGVVVTDPAAWAATLATSFTTFKPTLAAIDNEENDTFNAYTIAQYRAMITAAAPVAAAAGVPLTNGGLTSTGVALALWDYYWTTGQTQLADAFALRTLISGVNPIGDLYLDLPTTANPGAAILGSHPNQLTTMQSVQSLTAFYRTAGLSYVNIHLFNMFSDDVRAICQWAAMAAGLPVVCTAVGTNVTDGQSAISATAGCIQGGARRIIYFAKDGTGGGAAYGLVNSDGTIRPNGTAWAAFLAAQGLVR